MLDRRSISSKQTPAKMSAGLACGILWMIILACNFDNLPWLATTPSPTSIPSLDALRFTDVTTGQHFRRLNEFIEGYIDETWRTIAYHMTGNFYQARWCSGAGVDPDCEFAYSTKDKRDQHILELYTLFYQDFPVVSGLGFQATWVPKDTGWGAWFYFSEGGGKTVGEGWGVTFSEYTSSIGQPTSEVTLGGSYSYKINDTSIEYSPTLQGRADLAIYLAGPEAMRERGLEQIRAMALKVGTALNTHQILTCDLQPYQGNGIPPVCISRLMTLAEESTALTRADAYFTDQERLLKSNYLEMYMAWMAAFPLDQFWY